MRHLHTVDLGYTASRWAYNSLGSEVVGRLSAMLSPPAATLTNGQNT